MPVHLVPRPLAAQALLRLKDIIMVSFLMMLELPDQMKAPEIAHFLVDSIHDKIPFTLVNQLVKKCMIQLSIWETRNTFPASMRTNCLLFFELICCQKLTELRIHCIFEYITEEILALVGNLVNLRELVIINDDEDIRKNIPTTVFVNLQRLEKVILRELCTDEILAVISEKCPKIRYLNIIDSITVSDKSIQFIEMFSILESLNITETGLSEVGTVKILMGLSKFKSLNRFSCKCLSNPVLEVLISEFPHLKLLRLVKIQSELKVTKSFEDLRCFVIRKFKTEDKEKYRMLLGKRLTELHLWGTSELDTNFLLEKFPSLHKLVLEIDSLKTKKELSHIYENLEELFIDSKDTDGISDFLICCPNVKELTLVTSEEFYLTQLQRVVFYNPFRSLKILRLMQSRSNLSTSTVKFIVDNWSLDTFVVMVNEHIPNHYKDFPGVVVENIACWNESDF